MSNWEKKYIPTCGGLKGLFSSRYYKYCCCSSRILRNKNLVWWLIKEYKNGFFLWNSKFAIINVIEHYLKRERNAMFETLGIREIRKRNETSAHIKLETFDTWLLPCLFVFFTSPDLPKYCSSTDMGENGWKGNRMLWMRKDENKDSECGEERKNTNIGKKD